MQRQAAGEDFGLTVSEPRVLYDVFSVIVHLAPHRSWFASPLCFRPPIRTSPETQTAQQHSELAVTGWLADRGIRWYRRVLWCPVNRFAATGFR